MLKNPNNPYVVEEFNQLPLSISYQFTKGQDTRVVTKELFKYGSSFPSRVTIPFENKFGNFGMLLHYSNTVNN